MNATLLIELLTEELPPKALAKISEAFTTQLVQALQSRDLLESGAKATSYATPRRLAVSISQVRAISPEKNLREKVLPVSVAVDANGKPTAPLAKKLQAMGFPHLTIADLEKASDGKAESFFYSYTAPGLPLNTGLQASLDESLAKLPIPKLMSYQRPNGDTVHFVRPVHKLIALHGKDVVNIQAFGIPASHSTLGHRFLSQGEIRITDANDYASILMQQGKVMPSFEERKNHIKHSLIHKAGVDKVLMPESLLDEVNSLVEWPCVYECQFEEQFLDVPQECLVLTMQTNQKYFALTDENGKLRSRFLIVSNIETATPKHIIEGNERVVRPRLSDAQFFFEQDKKKKLIDRTSLLANVVYHNKLGNQFERSQRVQKLASAIAQLMQADTHLAERAAQLAKADLLTDMVGEFPELQGTMGRYYALHDGENTEVATAIAEHYQPKFAGDALPSTATGTALALADKLETIVGIWGIGLQPTGDKDPFALRRHALGVLRMLIEKRLTISLTQLLTQAHILFVEYKDYKDSSADILAFLYDRLRGLLKDKNFTQNEVEALVAQEPELLHDVLERLSAVQTFAQLPEAAALAAANKRITNILKKAEGYTKQVQTQLLQDVAEKELHMAIEQMQPQVKTAVEKQDYTLALKTLSSLRDKVDAFFNDVMVNAEDPALKNNRLALLSTLHGMMNQVADISKLAA